VLRLEVEANRVVVGPGAGLFSDSLVASELHLQSEELRSGPFRAMSKIRQNHRPVPCLASPLSGGSLRVDFDQPQRAVAPGQSLVLYGEDGLVLGGALIEKAI
jgi:tRNA-specific 2-thiouridylase